MLLEIFERRSSETNRKSVVHVFKCDTCEKTFEGSACRNKGIKHFCNVKCMGQHKREHPNAWPDNGKARNTPEACEKAMKTRKRRIDAGEIVHSWLGRHHSEETKKHLSEIASDGSRLGSGNGMFGRKHSEKTRSKMSDAKTQLILDGKFRAYGTHNKKGWYKSTKSGQECFFRSGWEEAFMKYLDVNDDILIWEYEKLRISYFYSVENVKRWYVPDFFVIRKDGTRQLIEVKHKEFAETERVKLKQEAGESWCRENNATFVTATKQVLADWGVEGLT